MYTASVEALLEDFVTISDEIQGVAMVSNQGQPLTRSVGFSEESTLNLAGKMLHLAGCVSGECDWHLIDKVTIQAEEGYLILIQCTQDAFLLIRAKVVPTGYIQHHIQQYLEKFKAAFQRPSPEVTIAQQDYYLGESPLFSHSPGGSPQDLNTHLPQVSSSVPMYLNEFEIAFCQKELTETIGPIASVICNSVLKQNPDLRLTEYIKALSHRIPDSEMAYKFRKRLMPDIPLKNC